MIGLTRFSLSTNLSALNFSLDRAWVLYMTALLVELR